ncbi:hypothetical protein CA839_05265 [Fusobacterium polymorphum]|uniref:Uncharacterized protein n=1 Tax=Fusobacterium nucleatum subsp. polymorphum TaxID=76857 RepID=A0A246EFE9_FUSNP|nr:phosphoribosyltransferase [Fusobacterium polymorphum]OWP25379.1 hypothetical protein CA839_05265 [Fusobacterium polymorphum]
MFEKIYEIYGADILYLYEYTPFYGGNSIQNETDRHIMNIKNQKNYNPEDPDFWQDEKREKSISFFKNVLKKEFTDFIKLLPSDFGQKTLISLVPSSTEKKYNNNMLNICEYLCREFNILNGLTILSRCYSIETAHLCCGQRSIQPHLDSIIVNTPEIIKDKSIILFDDVTTSGCTFEACKELLLNNGAKEVLCIALGKTKEK